VKALYREKCSACHALPDPVEKGLTRAQWRVTVDRMLTKYHASDSISPDQARQIVNYLATFAPGRAPNGPSANDAGDVWPAMPASSHVFTFAGPSALAGLIPASAGGAKGSASWKPLVDNTAPDGSIVRIRAAGADADRSFLLLADKYPGHDLDLHTSFRVLPDGTSSAVGIVVGYRDPSDYDIVRCQEKSHYVAFTQIRGGMESTVKRVDIPDVAAPRWRVLRVQCRDGRLRAWLDYNKLIDADQPDYTGGKAGLWTQGDTAADFDDLAVDVYDAPASSQTAPLPK
jgi:hypothetical protein